MRKKHKNRIVYGVGINDADYQISQKDANGKQHLCPYYSVWKSMMNRCYGNRHSPWYNQAYNKVTVNPIWHKFSNFKNWMEKQPYWSDKNMELDKDILIKGNTEYGPDVCMFVPKPVNNFFKYDYDDNVGVHFCKIKSKWVSKCGYNYHNKYHKNKEEARITYLNTKIKMGEEIAKNVIKEERLRIAFLNRLVPYRNLAQSLQESLATPSTAPIMPV